LFERGKLKIQQASVDAPNVKTDMRCRRRYGEVATKRGDLPNATSVLRIGQRPFHA
jgi:hypothetical protein